MGDGALFEAGPVVDYSYTEPGVYTASVTVRDACGREALADIHGLGAGDLPPEMLIESPTGTMSFSDRDRVELLGQGVDPEEGELPGHRMSWELSGDPLGMGRQLPLSPLPPDDYAVTLTGNDSMGNAGDDTAFIAVTRWTPVNGGLLAWDGSRARCAIAVQSLFRGEMLRWSWLYNGSSSFEQIFTTTADIPEMVIAQSYPYPLAAGDTVAVEVSYLGSHRTQYTLEFSGAMDIQ